MGVIIPKEKQQVKRKLSTDSDHTKKIKTSIKKKKKLSNNWKVSDI